MNTRDAHAHGIADGRYSAETGVTHYEPPTGYGDTISALYSRGFTAGLQAGRNAMGDGPNPNDDIVTAY